MQVQPNTRVVGLLARCAKALGADQRLESQLLLAHALQRPRAWLYAHAEDVVAESAVAVFDALVGRRLRGEPIAQILGRQGFWSLDLRITADVLIPRAETELLVERALAVLPAHRSVRVADLGTGSGAIALAIASELPLADVIAVDASIAALDVARTNAEGLGLSSRVRCVHGDWFASLHGEHFDAIVSNPPYLAADDPHLNEGDLRFEPRAALVSGSSGLDAIHAIVHDAPTHLLAGGWLLLEHGWEQGAAVRRSLAAAGFVNVGTHCDIEARERVTCGTWV